MGPRPSGADFWARLCPWPIFGTPRPPAKSGAFRVPRTNFAHAPHQGYSPRVSWPFFRWGVGAPTFGRSFLGAAVPVAYFWHTKVARKVWRHSESGGRTWPARPPNAIAHPFLSPFSAGRTWRPGLRAVSFGRGCTRGLFLAHGGRPPRLVPFRVPRANFAHAPHQGYSPPGFWPFFRWGVLGPRPSGADFWARLCP